MSRQKSELLMTVGSRDFYPLQKCPDHVRKPPSLQFSGQQGSVPGAKRPGRQVNRLSPSMAEVTNRWIYTATSLMHIHGVDNYNFTLHHTRISLKVTEEEEETKNQEIERQIIVFNLSNE